MTLLSEKYKNDITVREIEKNDITVREIRKIHYCRRTAKMTLLSRNKKDNITVREIQKLHYCQRNKKKDISVPELQK
jgi:hypothetical protein